VQLLDADKLRQLDRLPPTFGEVLIVGVLVENNRSIGEGMSAVHHEVIAPEWN
jgi:hypothetical protein